MKKKLFAILLAFCGSFLFANETKTRIFSLDFSPLILGVRKQGWGLGFSYEQYIKYHTAFKVGFSHSTYIRTEDLLPTVNFMMSAEYYPFSQSLDKLYFSLGGEFDYIAYTKDEYDENAQRDFISIVPELGWKWRLNEYVSFDIHGGYKYIFEEENLTVPDDYRDYLTHGVVFGLGAKIRIIKLIKRLTGQE